MNKQMEINFFKERAYFYQNYFNLLNSELHMEEQERPIARASYYPDIEAGIVTVCWSKSWIEGKGLTKEEIDKTVFHEMIEILLVELRDLGFKYSSIIGQDFVEDEVDRRTHVIVRTLENVFWPLIKYKENQNEK